MKDRLPTASAGLERRLTTWDATLLTVGSVVGTGIFLTTSDIARAAPRPGLILLVWLVAGLLSLAGALTYAELGVMFPQAGGIYTYLKEAYGPLWGFLFGWTSFLVIMSGGIAAIALGFGVYFGGFVPWFAADHVLVSLPIAGRTWSLGGAQVAAVLAVLALTAVNAVGLRAGAGVQDVLTLLKGAAIVGLVVLGLLVEPRVTSGSVASTLGQTGLLAAFGVGLIGGLWAYDGWYGATFAAGEMKHPARSLPLGLIGGTVVVTALYLAVNWVYLRALSPAEMADSPRVGEAAAAALLGPGSARLVAAAIVLSSFGCLSATILYASRIYQPMAADGMFFRALARIDPRHHVPVRSLWAQGVWSSLLVVSGTYEQLYTYAIFAVLLFHVATAAAVFVLRRTRPSAARPYRVWGYPVVPGLFVLGCAWLVVNTLRERPLESIFGLGLVAAGLPAYALWRRR